MSRADMQLLGRDLTTQAAALAAGELSSVELVGQVLAAIDASQPAVNSYIAVDADAALAAASASDQRRARGQAGALEGLPVAVKDNIDVAGVRTTAGMGTRRDAPPASADSPSVAALRGAGAILVGKLNGDQTAQYALRTQFSWLVVGAHHG